jgi:GT2 family glycosyltransferase
MCCASMVRKQAFEAVGGFSDILHFRGEEQLLAMDLAALGWDLCYCRDLVAIHQPSTQRTSTAAQAARELRNRVLTTWMRRPMTQCCKATAILVWSALRDREHARGAAQAIARLPDVLNERRLLPISVERALAVLETR